MGPIYGAILGALYGPASFLWIVLGSIFAGGVHDYFFRDLSISHEGKSISEIVGVYLGRRAGIAMIAFSAILLILIGAVFMSGPAGLLTNLGFTGLLAQLNFCFVIILLLLLRSYCRSNRQDHKKYLPLFGAVLLIMAVSIGSMLLIKGYEIPEIVFRSSHPEGLHFCCLCFS